MDLYNKDNQLEKIGSLTFQSLFKVPVNPLPSTRVKKKKKEKVSGGQAMMNGLSPFFLSNLQTITEATKQNIEYKKEENNRA